MAAYELQSPCRVEDAQYIALSKVSAFFEEPWWRLSWTGRTRESIVQSVADRSPKNLLADREVRRHQKVVHLETGDIAGYARWIMPESHKDHWLNAQTPDVSDEEREVFDKRHAETEWNPRTENDKYDEHIDGWREKYKNENAIGKYKTNIDVSILRLNRTTLRRCSSRPSTQRSSKYSCQVRP
jgi:hypothetical protein